MKPNVLKLMLGVTKKKSKLVATKKKKRGELGVDKVK